MSCIFWVAPAETQKLADTDHFDDSVIIHEYGHFLEDVYGKSFLADLITETLLSIRVLHGVKVGLIFYRAQ